MLVLVLGARGTLTDLVGEGALFEVYCWRKLGLGALVTGVLVIARLLTLTGLSASRHICVQSSLVTSFKLALNAEQNVVNASQGLNKVFVVTGPSVVALQVVPGCDAVADGCRAAATLG